MSRYGVHRVEIREVDMMHLRALCLFVVIAMTAATGVKPAQAASASDRCLAVSRGPELLQRVSLKETEAKLTYIGHSTFVIESPKGVRIATDYNDYVRPPFAPDIATMNRAHSTHFTMSPESSIRHVLRGWGDAGLAAQHDIAYEDVRVRNVVTNIRDFAGGTELYANSIFVFEVGGLCIAHLGHLHHPLTTRHLSQIGLIDVVLAPVDGSYTLDLAGMVEVIRNLRARLVVPMHYFSEFGLQRFLDRLGTEFPVKRHETSNIVLSRSMLPADTQVLVLRGGG
jgi:L-ascorbate metabolism protein UlaG (beta-lactamase superfamily)